MTKIVIDTNIVFSALLNVNSRIGQILINGNKFYYFFSPEYIRFEILKHQDKLKSLAKLTDDEFLETYELIMRNIKILNHSLIPLENYKKAEELCKSIDIDDTVFIAVAEFTKGKLWTGDIKLYNGLYDKGYKKLIKTENLYNDFIEKEKQKK
jgi:predicted nucleic acid-binding protein